MRNPCFSCKTLAPGVVVYRKKENTGQLEFIDFHMKFGGELNPRNRWVRLARLIPWQEFEMEYTRHFPSRTGNPAKPFRMALGALLIKEMKNLTDEELVEDIRENPYYQYLLGLESSQDEAPFDPSSLVHFRKRISQEMLGEINEKIVRRMMEFEARKAGDDDAQEDAGDASPSSSEDDEPAAPGEADAHKGKLLVDATCVPADIRYPTDLSLLNEAREKLEDIIDALHASMKGHVKKPRTYRVRARKDFLRVSRNRKPRKNAIRKGIRQQLQYIRRDILHIEGLAEKAGLTVLGKGQYRNLLVVHEVYRQQQEMFSQRKHKIENRIVSISQPHVRPIIRGKVTAPVEFGAKISVSKADGYTFLETLEWEPYNEGGKLKEHIGEYKRRFGYYPVSVHADKIYRTRENLSYCKKLGIRLGGPPLGRPPKDKEAYRALLRESRQDEIDRIPIEGVFGVAKRTYTLDRVRAKLDSTSGSTIAMVILAMNLKKIVKDLFVSFLWLFGYRNIRLVLV